MWEIFFTSLGGTTLALAVSTWLIKKFLDHQLKKDYIEFKNKMDLLKSKISSELESKAKKELINLEVELKGDSEEKLIERRAKEEYLKKARVKIYEIVEPLQIQLVLSSIALRKRIVEFRNWYIHEDRPFDDDDGYYQISSVYRLLHVFALTEVTWRKLSYLDLTISSNAVYILKMRRLLGHCFSEATVLPKSVASSSYANWRSQSSHIFTNNITKAASVLIAKEGDLSYVIGFEEFEQRASNPEYKDHLLPLVNITKNFNLKENPIFWVRMVAIAATCSWYVNLHAEKLMYSHYDVDLENLLSALPDEYIDNNLHMHIEPIKSLLKEDVWF